MKKKILLISSSSGLLWAPLYYFYYNSAFAVTFAVTLHKKKVETGSDKPDRKGSAASTATTASGGSRSSFSSASSGSAAAGAAGAGGGAPPQGILPLPDDRRAEFREVYEELLELEIYGISAARTAAAESDGSDLRDLIRVVCSSQLGLDLGKDEDTPLREEMQDEFHAMTQKNCAFLFMKMNKKMKYLIAR